MTQPLTPQSVLQQVLAFVANPKAPTTEQEANLRMACMDAEAQTELDTLALTTAKELLDWALSAHMGEQKLARILEQQTQQLMDVDEITADLSAEFARAYRQVDHQVQVAQAARDRLKMVVEGMFRSLAASAAQQAVCYRMGRTYLSAYQHWLVSYKQERAALDAFANALAETP